MEPPAKRIQLLLPTLGDVLPTAQEASAEAHEVHEARPDDRDRGRGERLQFAQEFEGGPQGKSLAQSHSQFRCALFVIVRLEH